MNWRQCPLTLAEEVSNDLIPDVDDTDGLDAESEFDAWRARELARLLREKTAQAQADAEREEIERRRAMPEDQRLAEDMAYADGTRAAEKGEMGFLQTYYHKGAFHQVSTSPCIRPCADGIGRRQRDFQTRLHGRERVTGGHVCPACRHAGPQLWQGELTWRRTPADKTEIPFQVHPSYRPRHIVWRLGYRPPGIRAARRRWSATAGMLELWWSS